MPYRKKKLPKYLVFKRLKKKGSFKKRVRAIVKAEVHRGEPPHYHTVGNTGVNVDTTPAFIDLSAIAQGDTALTRTGDRIQVNKLYGRFVLSRDPNVTSTQYDYVDLMIVKWLPDSSTEALNAVGQLFNTTVVAAGGGVAPFVLDLAARKKFRVIKTWRVTMGRYDDSAGNIPGVRRIDFYTRLKKRDQLITYNPGATTGRGKFYLFALGGFTTASNNNTVMNYQITSIFDP